MNKIKVGKIINTRGIKGELKVERTNNETFDRDVEYFIEGYETAIDIEKASESGNFSYIKLAGYDNINDVLKFKNKYILIESEDLDELEEDEYYIKDLVGLTAFDEDGNEIGSLKEVMAYDVNDIYVIATEDGNKLVPAVKEFIKKIDLENRTIVVKLIEGM